MVRSTFPAETENDTRSPATGETGHMLSLPPLGQVTNMGPEVMVRVAMHEEAKRPWQNALHAEWKVAQRR